MASTGNTGKTLVRRGLRLVGRSVKDRVQQRTPIVETRLLPSANNDPVRLPRQERDFLLSFEQTLLGATYQHWVNQGDGDWAAQRKSWFSRNERRCFACSSRDDIRLHHRTYERVANPLDDDLVALCESCHRKVHQYVEAHLADEGSLRRAHEVLRDELAAERDGKQQRLRASARARHAREAERLPVVLVDIRKLRLQDNLNPTQKVRLVNLLEEFHRLRRNSIG